MLVVEDEEPLRRIIVRSLARCGYRVSDAGSVGRAVERCHVDPPDVLVLDLTLPDGSGWEVLRHVASAGMPRPAVIAISAAPPGRQQLAEFAPVAFLPKPFPVDALLRAIEHATHDGGHHEALGHPTV